MLNSSFWVGLILGAMGGATLGAITMAICAMAKGDDYSLPKGADRYEPRHRNCDDADGDRVIAFGERDLETQQGHPRLRE
ncbi:MULTISPECIES: hypothetical protein [Bradyrhizobium]|uniref:hypothetical protein n=1 Tax=Bradyrhizobium liaoningense TaxID=43992 RepID=UPI001BA4BED2|nr:hypothetical protein [Bradyrhizobium liaoningense]MBR0879149.1 hypothetical protein [Bradyrhizobium liaoningense]